MVLITTKRAKSCVVEWKNVHGRKMNVQFFCCEQRYCQRPWASSDIYLGVEAHAKALALKRGVEWESLDPARRDGVSGHERAHSQQSTPETDWSNRSMWKLHSLKIKNGTLCGLWHKNPSVMRQRLFVTTTTLGDQYPRHKIMPSIIFWLGWCVIGWEKITRVIGRWTESKSVNPPTLTDLHTFNSRWKEMWTSAAW